MPDPGPPRLRVRFIILLARLLGTRAVSDLVQALEGDEEETYDAQASPEVAAIAADEREHAEIWKRLDGAGEEAARATVRAHPSGGDGRSERWHRTGQSGTLRAVIFGVSDGLVSNLSLVMGVAGATAVEPRFILLAGIAGLLAGSFSMAAGEYISMQSQRELYERQIALERAELEAMPGEEEAELARIYRSKGFSADEAGTIAHRIFQDPEAALDTLIREELGLDPVRARLTLGRGGRIVRGLRGRGEHPGHPVSLRRWRHDLHGQPRREPRRAVRGRGRRQPHHRAKHALLGRPAGAHRRARGRRDIRGRPGHRRLGRLGWPRWQHGPPDRTRARTPRRGSEPKASTPAAGRTARATATAPTTTATTRCSWSHPDRSSFGLPDRGERIALEVGDRLDLPAGTSHDALVGPNGVTCLEAHIPAGTLPRTPARRPAGRW